MFIKIKLEPQNSKALSPLKKISYFSIDDDATIIDLKIKIESYVDVPAERQEIRTLVNIFENSRLVKEVCEVAGTAVMLYAYDDNHEFGEPQFICFLQVYTNELAAAQQELENRSKLSIDKNKTKSSSSSTSSVTLVASSDTDMGPEETDTETSSTSDEESGSSTDNSESSFRNKRSKHEQNNSLRNKKLKVAAPSEVRYPESLCQYLDEFPKCSKNIHLVKDKEESALTQVSCESSNKTILPEDTNFSEKTYEIEKLSDNKAVPKENCQSVETELANKELSKVQSNKVTTTVNKENNHPCYSINPEIRDYLAIICTKDGKPLNQVEFENLLIWFFDRFRACESSNMLQFDNKTAIQLFDGKLWIACEDMVTCEWISASILQYSLKSYTILALKDFKHECEIVVPVVSSSKNILDVFDLLEKQNKNISTLKWSIKSRRTISMEDKDFNEKAVSLFCTNELLNISMDMESKTNIEKFDFKLKYCFWQIVFKFI